MNLSRDTLIDWLESLREYNDAQLHGSAIKLTRRVAIRAENDALGRTIRALVEPLGSSLEQLTNVLQLLCQRSDRHEQLLSRHDRILETMADSATRTDQVLAAMSKLFQDASHGQAMADLNRQLRDSHERLEAVDRERLRHEQSMPDFPTVRGSASEEEEPCDA